MFVFNDPLSGIQNLCYLNSALQDLAVIRSLEISENNYKIAYVCTRYARLQHIKTEVL